VSQPIGCGLPTWPATATHCALNVAIAPAMDGFRPRLAICSSLLAKADARAGTARQWEKQNDGNGQYTNRYLRDRG
jgi:hypothetical protein